MSDLKTNLQEILQEKQDKIIPENIKKDVQIFDVTGTYVGSGSSSGGDVKLFETVEEMQADSTAQEGDLAVVYKEGIQNMTAHTQTQYITFPETVVLSEALTSTIHSELDSLDGRYNLNILVSPSAFRMNGTTPTIRPNVRYSSSDGITYTLSSSIENPVDLGTEFKPLDAYDWDILGNFMQVSDINFGGLYEYNGTNYEITKNQYTLTSSNQLLPNVSAYGKNGNIVGDDSVYDNLDWQSIWIKYNILDSDVARQDDLRNVTNTNPIITYNSNNNSSSYINASERLNNSSHVIYNVQGNIVFHKKSCVKISDNEILTFYPNGDLIIIRKYTLNGDIVTIDLFDEQTSPDEMDGTYTRYFKYNSLDNCVYICYASETTLYLYKYDVATKMFTKLFSVSGNYYYFNCNFCFENNTLFLDSSSAEGFYKFTFDGTRTRIQSHTQMSSTPSFSNKYIGVKNGSNSNAIIYNMQTESYTSIITNSQSNNILCDSVDNNYTYLLTGTTLQKIQNDEVIKTTDIDFTYSSETEIKTSEFISNVDVPPMYEDEIIFTGLAINTVTDTAYADNNIPDSMFVLYKNNRNICTIYSMVYKYIGISTLDDGSGTYVAYKGNDNYYIAKEQTEKLKTGFELDETYENTISPEEYTTAVNTTEQILGEEETVNE